MAERQDENDNKDDNDSVRADVFGVKGQDDAAAEAPSVVASDDASEDPDGDIDSDESSDDSEDNDADPESDEGTEAALERKAHALSEQGRLKSGGLSMPKDIELAVDGPVDQNEIDKIMEMMRGATEGGGPGGFPQAGQPQPTYPPNVELQIRELYNLRLDWRAKIGGMAVPNPMDQWAVDKYNYEKSQYQAEADMLYQQILAVAREHNKSFIAGANDNPEVVISRIMADIRPPQRVVIRTVVTGRGNVMKT